MTENLKFYVANHGNKFEWLVKETRKDIIQERKVGKLFIIVPN